MTEQLVINSLVDLMLSCDVEEAFGCFLKGREEDLKLLDKVWGLDAKSIAAVCEIIGLDNPNIKRIQDAVLNGLRRYIVEVSDFRGVDS